MHILIRAATFDDVDVITEFNCRLAQETENRILNRKTVDAGVRRGLELGDEVQYFVAENEAGVIGQIMLTREWSDWRNGEFWWLQSVYVHAEFRRRGIFRRLMQHVNDLAKSTPGVVGLRLYMANDNRNAQQTYERCGFQFEHYVVGEQILSEAHRLS